MKLYLIFFYLLPFSSLLPNKDIQRRSISDDEFNYTFFVLSEEASSNDISKYYYWYKTGEIHSSQGSSSGSLLHGDYTKSYKDHNLAEKGSFKKGLKNDTWKRWYSNGQLYEVSNWKSGYKNGRYAQFSEEGKVLIQGAYKNHRKHGIWINTATKDTLYFKEGKEAEMPKKYKRKPFFQRAKTYVKKLFSKKEDDQKKDSTLKKAKERKNRKPKTSTEERKRQRALKKKVKQEEKERDQK